MNERIKELAEQAKLFTGWPNGETEYQKFAELLIQDFVWQVVKDDQVPQDIQVLIGNRVREHFGVEEN